MRDRLIAGPAILFLIEAAVRVFKIEPWMFPTPSAVALQWWTATPQLLPDLLATASAAIAGFLLSALFGAAVATALFLSPRADRLLTPFLTMTQNIPMIALAPLFAVWFGFGLLPKLLIILLFGFFPVAISALSGLKSTPAETSRTFIILGATRMFRLRHLDWPHALPAYFAGLRLAATYAIMGAIVAEWLGSEHGLGQALTMAAKSFQTPLLFAIILWIVLLANIAVAACRMLEKMLIKGGQSDAPVH
ncbi:ABC transporter permease [Exiguobacterium flavidum]|uniref:ABC transporter permease n=1 Tax=Exiguobacterium flavidum TaxID=2184695 RepID=UPI0013006AC7|nr:ABC transporter permease [Exiguobacterium flavidum]